ncbi:hypothetical protein [Desulfofalx alkaliphila]|uniref:hypothetical protein n=1 Tax=Desulfofalx alkaliphila TaxID=105483 RepID=UPI001A9A5EEB|nr:hypothetical protein [Desulfofalx alkaliphila]
MRQSGLDVGASRQSRLDVRGQRQSRIDVFLKIQGCESRMDVRVKNLKNRLTNMNENYRHGNYPVCK